MGNDNSGFFYKFRTLQSARANHVTTLIGELDIVDSTTTNNAVSKYYYMKDDSGVAIANTRNGYHCFIAKISIPKSFYHVKYTFNKITGKGKIEGDSKVHLWGEELPFMTNIIDNLDARNVIRTIGERILEVDPTELRGKSFTFDFKTREFDPNSSPRRLRGCGGATGLECRKCFKYENGTHNKIFCTKDGDGNRTFYVPTLGKTRNNFSDVVYFRIDNEDELWDWLSKAQMPLAGIAVMKPIPDPIDFDNVKVSVVDDLAIMFPKPSCPGEWIIVN